MSSSRPLDNLNPTIIAPTAPTAGVHLGKASQKTKLERLWHDDDEADEVGGTFDVDDEEREEIDEQEVFGTSLRRPSLLMLTLPSTDLLRSITDPEHPLTLEQLAVVSASQIKVSNKKGAERVLIEFTPTIPHCSMATLIGEPTKPGGSRCGADHWLHRPDIESEVAPRSPAEVQG